MPKLDFTNLVTLVTEKHETQKEFCEELQIRGRPKGISRSTKSCRTSRTERFGSCVVTEPEWRGKNRPRTCAN